MPEDHSDDLRSRRNEWRLDALDKWRKDIEARIEATEHRIIERLASLEETITKMSNAQEIANRVADEIGRRDTKQNRLRLTLFQKLGGGTFALFLTFGPALIVKYL